MASHDRRDLGIVWIRDLEAATGVGIASLYNAFGGKRALFLAALQRYSEQRTRACIREIEQIASPAARIIDVAVYPRDQNSLTT